jgi:8-oxo-dGTP pyrophosphatase MutT (NUDIX family)
VAARKADGSATPIRAAGGAVWRRCGEGPIEIVLIHRASYDDWTLPKGKVERGETDEIAAVREVEEETGVLCRLGPELPPTSYRDRYGRPKVVRYWAMTVVVGEVAGHHEVDDARWVPLAAARQRLSYERDIGVIDALEATLGAA